MALTEQDCEALRELNISGWTLGAEHDPGCPGDEHYCVLHCPVPVQLPVADDEITAAIEAIVARHVAAALNEAADLVHLSRPEPERDGEPGNWKRGERYARLRAARIVRTAAQQSP